MTSGPGNPQPSALEEIRLLCAPYVGMLVANGDAAAACRLQARLKAVSLEIREDDGSAPALRRQLDMANRQVETLSQQVRDLSLRLMAANGELRREVARADRAESAVRAQMPAPRDDFAGASSEAHRG